jgi:hypothetical protein
MVLFWERFSSQRSYDPWDNHCAVVLMHWQISRVARRIHSSAMQIKGDARFERAYGAIITSSGSTRRAGG